MKKLTPFLNTALLALTLAFFAVSGVSAAGTVNDVSNNASVVVGFQIPSIPDVISFAIKFLFFLAGLAALIFLLLGAFSWVTSSGDKEAVKKAQDKIQAAVVGLVVIVLVLAVIVTLEQFVFNQHLCLGISCPVNFKNYVLLNN